MCKVEDKQLMANPFLQVQRLERERKASIGTRRGPIIVHLVAQFDSCPGDAERGKNRDEAESAKASGEESHWSDLQSRTQSAFGSNRQPGKD